MGFEELSSELHRNAESEGRKLVKAAEKNAEKIVEDAKAKAEENVAAAKKEAAELAKQEASERITSAKLAAKKMLDEARDEAVERCLAQEWHEFKASSMKKSYYPGFLDALVKDGMAELGSSQATIYVRDEDRQLLPGFPLKKLPPEYCGGVILESQNGKVRVNKTLEEIFSQKRLQLRKEAYDKMF